VRVVHRAGDGGEEPNGGGDICVHVCMDIYIMDIYIRYIYVYSMWIGDWVPVRSASGAQSRRRW